MGWGKKTMSAKPQPATAPRYEAIQLSDSVILNVPKRRVAAHPALAAPYGDEPPEKPSASAKAEMAWAQLKSKKGWVPETIAMILYEFVKDRGLFDDLVKFAKGRK